MVRIFLSEWGLLTWIANAEGDPGKVISHRFRVVKLYSHSRIVFEALGLVTQKAIFLLALPRQQLLPVIKRTYWDIASRPHAPQSAHFHAPSIVDRCVVLAGRIPEYSRRQLRLLHATSRKSANLGMYPFEEFKQPLLGPEASTQSTLETTRH